MSEIIIRHSFLYRQLISQGVFPSSPNYDDQVGTAIFEKVGISRTALSDSTIEEIVYLASKFRKSVQILWKKHKKKPDKMLGADFFTKFMEIRPTLAEASNSTETGGTKSSLLFRFYQVHLLSNHFNFQGKNVVLEGLSGPKRGRLCTRMLPKSGMSIPPTPFFWQLLKLPARG